MGIIFFIFLFIVFLINFIVIASFASASLAAVNSEKKKDGTSDADVQNYNAAAEYLGWTIALAWTMVAITIVLIIIAIVLVVLAFGTGVGEAGVAAGAVGEAGAVGVAGAEAAGAAAVLGEGAATAEGLVAAESSATALASEAETAAESAQKAEQELSTLQKVKGKYDEAQDAYQKVQDIKSQAQDLKNQAQQINDSLSTIKENPAEVQHGFLGFNDIFGIHGGFFSKIMGWIERLSLFSLLAVEFAFGITSAQATSYINRTSAKAGFEDALIATLLGIVPLGVIILWWIINIFYVRSKKKELEKANAILMKAAEEQAARDRVIEEQRKQEERDKYELAKQKYDEARQQRYQKMQDQMESFQKSIEAQITAGKLDPIKGQEAIARYNASIMRQYQPSSRPQSRAQVAPVAQQSRHSVKDYIPSQDTVSSALGSVQSALSIASTVSSMVPT